MAISLVVVSATPRATNSVSAARSTRALVSSAFPIASVYEGPLTLGSSRARHRLGAGHGEECCSLREPTPVDDPIVGLGPALEQQVQDQSLADKHHALLQK